MPRFTTAQNWKKETPFLICSDTDFIYRLQKSETTFEVTNNGDETQKIYLDIDYKLTKEDGEFDDELADLMEKKGEAFLIELLKKSLPNVIPNIACATSHCHWKYSIRYFVSNVIATKSSISILVKKLNVMFNTDKEENVYDREGTSVREYLIYTDYNDNEVFQNVNDFFYFKSHSSDLYDQIRVGEHYRISISGWKMQLFSKERNIISIERIVDHVQGQEMKEETSVPIKTEIEKVEKDTLSVDDFLEEIDAEPIEESTDSVSTPIIDL